MTLDDRSALEAHFRRALGLPVALEALASDAPLREPAPHERTHLARFGDPRRAASWMRGRQALERLVARLGADGTPGFTVPVDPGRVVFPHACLSLTHTGDRAVAVGIPAGAAFGVGVDLELRERMREGAERFFLGPDEARWLLSAAVPRRDRDRVRLWTVKEAVFKANPRNRGSLLGHYLLADPGAAVGTARWKEEPGAVFRYASADLNPGALSIAIRLPDEPA
jgi:4'-phosphopantetheinyl transferase EntD